MCMQCETKSRAIRYNILPDWHLVRAYQTYDYWKAGEYALLRCNDPDFIFTTPIRKEPSKGDQKRKIDKAWWKWTEETEKFREELHGDLNTCYELYRACQKAGYKGQDKDGYLAWWLRKYMYNKLYSRKRK